MKYWHKTLRRVRTAASFALPCFSLPFLGAVIGVVIGVAPPLRQLFFNDITH
jgi:hypothetical protein